MRYATMEENAAAAVIAKETSKTSGHTEDKKAYIDATRVEVEPVRTTKVKKTHLKQKPKLQSVEDQRSHQRRTPLSLKGESKTPRSTGVIQDPEPQVAQLEDEPIQAEDGQDPGDDDEAISDPEFEDEMGMPPTLGQLKRRASEGQVEALDDVPLQFKKSKYQDMLAGSEQLPELAMQWLVEFE